MSSIDDRVINDLMKKVADDVTAAIIRTLSICPRPHLPLLTAAAAAALGVMASELDRLAGNKALDPDNVLLAGLLSARMGTVTDDPTGAAYKDFAVLENAGLTGSGR